MASVRNRATRRNQGTTCAGTPAGNGSATVALPERLIDDRSRERDEVRHFASGSRSMLTM